MQFLLQSNSIAASKMVFVLEKLYGSYRYYFYDLKGKNYCNKGNFLKVNSNRSEIRELSSHRNAAGILCKHIDCISAAHQVRSANDEITKAI